MQDNINQIQEVMAKRTAKNSVFLDLFQNKCYLLKLYKTLHPEDTTATEESLTDVTIENVLTDNLYNDLGFIVENRLMILIRSTVYIDNEYFSKSFTVSGAKLSRIFSAYQSELLQKQESENAQARTLCDFYGTQRAKTG